MGIYKNGGANVPQGKTGNTVSYMLNGQMVSRSIGKVWHRTKRQRANEAKMKFVNQFLKPFKPVLNMGLKNSPRKQTQGVYNLAFAIHRATALTGEYPDLQIDLTKVRLSVGSIPVPENASVVQNGSVLDFRWNADMEAELADQDDQVMLVAYFPKSRKVIYDCAGAKRGAEFQQLPLTSFVDKTVAEVFVAFISGDRKDVSDTVYLGQVILSLNK